MKLPNYIEIETSRFCNRHCEWCPNDVLKNRTVQELMPWEHFEKIVRSLSNREYSGWFAFHNYNEPLANPRIVQELRFAREGLSRAKLTIFTNGDYLTSEMFSSVVSAGLTQMRVTVYPQNCEQAVSHGDLWRWVEGKSFLRTKDWKEVFVRQGPALEFDGNPEIILVRPLVQKYYDRGGTIPFLSIENRTMPCFLTSNSLSVDYQGDIKMCCNVVSGNECHQKYVLGNVRDHDLIEVWNSQGFEDIRELHRKADWSETPICKTCRQEMNSS